MHLLWTSSVLGFRFPSAEDMNFGSMSNIGTKQDPKPHLISRDFATWLAEMINQRKNCNVIYNFFKQKNVRFIDSVNSVAKSSSI